jgi:bifunctional DNA-binding transcriptional regulator/antitoxin component of YhaV-PrlF toxin-antitoxin module
MPLKKSNFLHRKVLPAGQQGKSITIPAEVWRDIGLEVGDAVDLQYDREESVLTVHLPESEEAGEEEEELASMEPGDLGLGSSD